MQQLLREWPPGFGGVERVAHGLGEELGGSVFCLKKPSAGDPWPVAYERRWLPALASGRFFCPLPSRALGDLLGNGQPLIVHLPCPTLLLLLWLARLCRPQRRIWVYWHAFLDPRPGRRGAAERLYQAVALLSLRCFAVVTTSPPLQQALIEAGVPPRRLTWLPCCLPQSLETALIQIPRPCLGARSPAGGRVIAIGRLESYKRIDWLLQAMAQTPALVRLDVVGEGPQRPELEAQAARLLTQHQHVVFHGRVDEKGKCALLAQADLLVLPADRCNEAFGIVQLEAMAAGIPSLAFALPRSGMFWVSAVPVCPWAGEPNRLAAALQQLLADPALRHQACQQSRQRYLDQFAVANWQHRCHQVFCVDG